jgi:hypothetical protein
MLVCAVLALLAAAGCGGDDGGDGDDIASEGNELCREIGAKAEQIQTPTRRFELLAHSLELRTIYEQGLTEFRQLDPPAEDREEFDEFLVTLEELVRILREREEFDELSRRERARNIERGEEVFAAFPERAEAAGFDDCA